MASIRRSRCVEEPPVTAVADPGAGALSVADVQRLTTRVVDVMAGAILGKRAVLEVGVACALARGHLLIGDNPGLGKTTLAKALAGAIGGTVSRVQGTPDLMPFDVTGGAVYENGRRV